MTQRAFQDLMPQNFCFGCGADNPDGLHLKSYWDGEEAISRFAPQPHLAAGPKHILNGGIIATIIDCHSICTAVADAFRRDGREIGSEPDLWYATGSLTVRYLRPTPLAEPVDLHAVVLGADERRTNLECQLTAGGKVCAEAEVVAVKVPASWRHGRAE